MCRTFTHSVSSWELKIAVTHGITFLTADAYVPTLSRNVRNWLTELNFTDSATKPSKIRCKMFKHKL
jgi:hypothetical protein